LGFESMEWGPRRCEHGFGVGFESSARRDPGDFRCCLSPPRPSSRDRSGPSEAERVFRGHNNLVNERLSRRYTVGIKVLRTYRSVRTVEYHYYTSKYQGETQRISLALFDRRFRKEPWSATYCSTERVRVCGCLYTSVPPTAKKSEAT
jgi:hypothetical protein